MVITPLGDQALLVQVASEPGESAFARVQQAAQALRDAEIATIRDIVPSFASVGLMLDETARLAAVREAVEAVLSGLPAEAPPVRGREREIPVCHDSDFAPDLPHIAEHAGMTPEAVLALLHETEFCVHAVGFAPGFPYLAGLPPELHVPRRATPRSRVPRGSVAIGGAQCGVYPLETPGGWHLLGRTPRLLFEPRAEPPAWLEPGDRVRFVPVDRKGYNDHQRAAEEARRALIQDTHPPFETRRVIQVVRPGAFTTIQDLGRYGWQFVGVPVGGALDALSLRCANLLVGNEPGAAAIEWTMRGPVLEFATDCCVALMGAAPADLQVGRPWIIHAGEILDLSHAQGGIRGILAVSGGIDVPLVMGSRSTCLRAHFGGFRGRVLRSGDTLGTVKPSIQRVSSAWSIAPGMMPRSPDAEPLRVVRGPQADWFSDAAWGTLVSAQFTVTADADRMGVRLKGPQLSSAGAREMTSAAVTAGAIQVPPDGQPIILLADRQTLGGYPQIGYVISVDVARLAQARPGTVLSFREISLEEAEAERLDQVRSLGLLSVGLASKRA